MADHMILGIDVDGVLAKFEEGYAPLITAVTGIQFPHLGEADWPSTWYWERAAGVTKEQEDEIWRRLKDDEMFWYNLPAHEGAEDFLQGLKDLEDQGHDVYFITNRMGKAVKLQTEAWLSIHGMERPTVLVSSQKGACCGVLGVTHYVDDKPENCQDVVVRCEKTKVYMLARPWNYPIQRMPRVTLEQFIEEVEKDGNIARGLETGPGSSDSNQTVLV